MRSPFVSPRAGKKTLSRLVTATSRSPTRTPSLCAECGHHFRDARGPLLRPFGADHTRDVLLAPRERKRIECRAQLRGRERFSEIARDRHGARGGVRFERHVRTLPGRELGGVADLPPGRQRVSAPALRALLAAPVELP